MAPLVGGSAQLITCLRQRPVFASFAVLASLLSCLLLSCLCSAALSPGLFLSHAHTRLMTCLWAVVTSQCCIRGIPMEHTAQAHTRRVAKEAVVPRVPSSATECMPLHRQHESRKHQEMGGPVLGASTRHLRAVGKILVRKYHPDKVAGRLKRGETDGPQTEADATALFKRLAQALDIVAQAMAATEEPSS